MTLSPRHRASWPPALALAGAVLGLLAAAPAHAGNGWDHGPYRYGYDRPYYGYYYAPPPVYYAPRPRVYYRPPPPPVYYAPPPPAYYYPPAPVYLGVPSIGLQFNF